MPAHRAANRVGAIAPTISVATLTLVCVPNVRELANATWRYRRLQADGVCPTTWDLVAEREIDPESRFRDRWGEPFRIECVRDFVIVSAAGRDRKWGTADDIIVRLRTELVVIAESSSKHGS